MRKDKHISLHVSHLGIIIVGLYPDVLLIVSKVSSEQGQPSAVGGVSWNGKGQVNGAVVIEVEILDRCSGDPVGTVYKGALGVDDQGFQESVLI